MKKINNCIDCGRKITGKKYCQECYLKNHNPFVSLPIEQRSKANLKHGNTLKIGKCIDCGKKLSKLAYYYKCKRCHSCATKKKYKDNLQYGNFIDGRTLKKYYCIDCKEEISYWGWKYGNLLCSSCAVKGERHWNYIDGKSKEPYPLEFSAKLKSKIRKRDNYTCQKCNKKQEDNIVGNKQRKLDIHHIDYNKQNCKEENLITLCGKCNIEVNYNRNHWKNYFREKRLCQLIIR